MSTLTIATRASKLALWQAEFVAGRIRALNPSWQIRFEIVKTKGDVILDAPLAKIGGKGLFVREIEEALLNGKADIAVHSMKDLPSELPPGLSLGAVTERADARDIFLSVKYESLEALPQGACLGTSSLRRQSQALAANPGLIVKALRGNVDTRLAKLNDGLYDAIILAAAGVTRLGLSAPRMRPFEPAALLPAPGQGALGVEFMSVREDLGELLKKLDHRPTRLAVTAERAFSAQIGGSCQVPAAAHAVFEDGSLHMDALVASVDGGRIIRRLASRTAMTYEDASQIGAELAVTIKKAGGADILQSLGL